MSYLKIYLPIIILLFLSYFAVRPLFVAGFFPIHDDTQIARVFEMKKALVDGEFPVRWVADLGYGYGYPIFNFYAPFAYYVGGLITMVGVNALNATKIMMGIGIVLAGVFMYLFAKELWGRGGGLVAGLLYLYAPYHAVDLYVRGDVAEFWASAFIPLLFYGLWKAHKEKSWFAVVIGSLGYAGIIVSHNLTAMMVTPFALLFALYLYIIARFEKKLYKPYYPLLILFVGILLAGFYWLPVLSEMQYTNVLSQIGGGADYKDHFVCLQQLWDSPWGYGGSAQGCVDGLSFKIGKLHIILFLLSFVSLFFLHKKDKTKFWFCVLATISIFFSIFLMLPQSHFVWDTFSQMAFFQYPWRFLIIVSFFISFLGGSVIWLVRKYLSQKIFLACFIGFLSLGIVYLNSDVFRTQTDIKKTATNYTNSYDLKWTASRISDEYMPKNFLKPQIASAIPQNKIVATTGVTINSFSEKTQEITAKITAKSATKLLINQAYFPGWHVYVDGVQSTFGYFNKGLMVTVPAGSHQLSIRFLQTPVENAGNGLSLAGFLILLIGIIYSIKQIHEHKKA